MREIGALLSITTIILWAITALQDSKRREVSVFVLGGLALLALAGRPWPWWALTAAALLWPPRDRRHATLLGLAAVACGALSGDMAAGLALGGGVLAWALGWWGGADGIALAALGLRYGLAGLVAGLSIAALAGAVLMVARTPRQRQGEPGQGAGREPTGRLWALAGALGDVLALKPLDGDIPAEREMPAAAALAAGGILLEASGLWQTVFG